MQDYDPICLLHFEVDSAPEAVIDEIALEEPLEIQVDTRPVSVTMRTPGHDEELAIGFLLGEGIIRTSNDILRIRTSERNQQGNVLEVFLAPDLKVDFKQLTRHVFASSACGLCGKTTIELVQQQFKPVSAQLSVSADIILRLKETFEEAQEGFHRTGGLHAAALFSTGGELVVLREDVGRHNAVDKVLGYSLLQNLLPLDRHILMVSGRISFEIIQKALAAGLSIVAAVSAPTSLAVHFAQASGQTLVGFLRGERMNIYSNAERIFSPSGASTIPVETKNLYQEVLVTATR